MLAAPERHSQTLDANVHARLLIRHVILASPCSGPEGTLATRGDISFSEPKQHVLTLQGSNNDTLKFCLVRVLGTAVHQQSFVVGGVAREFLFLDDGTGVVAVTLSRQECVDEDQQAIRDEMALRLSLYSCAQPASTGLAVEVFGRIAHCPDRAATTAPPTPDRWIECDQLSVRADPMAYSSAIIETLAVYRNYFPARHDNSQYGYVPSTLKSGLNSISGHGDDANALEQQLAQRAKCRDSKLLSAGIGCPQAVFYASRSSLSLQQNGPEAAPSDGLCDISDIDDEELLDALKDMDDIPLE